MNWTGYESLNDFLITTIQVVVAFILGYLFGRKSK
jgi:hypothetical protein